MSEQTYVLAAGDARPPDALRAELAERPDDPELSRRTPDLCGGFPRRAMAARLGTPETAGPRARRVRQSLFDH
jgi:hypothetical protein